jgi:hypothetical protein
MRPISRFNVEASMIMKMVEVLNCTNLDTDQIIIKHTFGFTKEVNTFFFSTTLCDQVCLLIATGRWFSPVSSTNKTDRHDKAEILLKVAYNTINKRRTKKRKYSPPL